VQLAYIILTMKKTATDAAAATTTKAPTAIRAMAQAGSDGEELSVTSEPV